jgi:hypothetical protein
MIRVEDGVMIGLVGCHATRRETCVLFSDSVGTNKGPTGGTATKTLLRYRPSS